MQRLSLLTPQLTASQEPLTVAITGAAGNIGYALVFLLSQYPPLQNRPLVLNLIELPMAFSALKGVLLELSDSNLKNVSKINVFSDVNEGFKGADVAILVGAKPRTKGMERKDLLRDNAFIFKDQAIALDKFANENVKILVVGNPANTNAAIIAHLTKRIKKENISALTRLDMNRLIGQISLKSNIPVQDIRRAIIWGNHSSTQYPDARYIEVREANSKKWVKLGKLSSQMFGSKDNSKPSDEKAISAEEKAYFTSELVEKVQKRGAEIIDLRKSSSAASAAMAIVMHLRDWLEGTTNGEWASMAVWSNGNPYGVKEGLIYSFPVECKKGKWELVKGLDVKDEFSRKMMAETEKELVEELETALAVVKNK